LSSDYPFGIFKLSLKTNISLVSILAAAQWFSPGIPVSPTNKTDRHDITEILLKVALNNITLTKPYSILFPNR
jgi:hypothetical protein